MIPTRRSGADPGRWSRWILWSTATILVTVWLAVILVDVFDAMGMRQRLFVDRGSELTLYRHLADNNRPLEWVQWLWLIGGSITAAVVAGSYLERGEHASSRGAVLLAALLGLLSIKDAGSPRHVLRGYAESIAGSTAESVTELAIFGLLGAFAVFVFIRVWPLTARDRACRQLLIAGYAAYGIAAMSSATRGLWYEAVGDWALRTVFAGRPLEVERAGWFFMDSLVEESVEFIAIGLLVAMTARLLRQVHAPPRQPDLALSHDDRLPP